MELRKSLLSGMVGAWALDHMINQRQPSKRRQRVYTMDELRYREKRKKKNKAQRKARRITRLHRKH